MQIKLSYTMKAHYFWENVELELNHIVKATTKNKFDKRSKVLFSYFLL